MVVSIADARQMLLVLAIDRGFTITRAIISVARTVAIELGGICGTLLVEGFLDSSEILSNFDGIIAVFARVLNSLDCRETHFLVLFLVKTLPLLLKGRTGQWRRVSLALLVIFNLLTTEHIVVTHDSVDRLPTVFLEGKESHRWYFVLGKTVENLIGSTEECQHLLEL